jgi:hypothetical protein
MGRKYIAIIKLLKYLIFFQIFFLLLTNNIFANNNLYEKQLILDMPIEIYEGQIFSISVYTFENNTPEYQINSTIFFNNKSYKITNENPELSIDAPNVIEDTIFEISATKYGYIETKAYILIKDINNENQSQIIITILDNNFYIEGNSYFLVLITDEKGTILPDVKISIKNYFENNPINVTDDEGKAYIFAPNDSEKITIIAQKDGYIEGSKTVFINLNDDILQKLIKNQYFIIFITIIILILSIVRVYKNKKIKTNERNQSNFKNNNKIINRNHNKHIIKDINEKNGSIKESKIEEIRINKKNFNNNIISVENFKYNTKKQNKKMYNKNKKGHWFEGLEEMREKIDNISIPIDDKKIHTWFEGKRDIEKLIDEKIKNIKK